MKKVIVKAIVKATKADKKTAHIPFYKGITAPTTAPTITTAPTTAPTITTAPTTAPTTTQDLYVYILRYTIETYRAVINFPISWENACKELHKDIKDFERFLYACNRDYWKYTLLYYFYTELSKNPHIRENWDYYHIITNLWLNAMKNKEKYRPFYGKFGF